MSHELQIQREQLFSRDELRKSLREWMVNAVESRDDAVCSLVPALEEWINTKTWASKDARKAIVAEEDIYNVLTAMMVAIVPATHVMPIQSAGAAMASTLNWFEADLFVGPDGDTTKCQLNAVRTACEIIAGVSLHTNLFTVDCVDDVNGVRVKSELMLSPELEEAMVNAMYMPPNIVPPEVRYKNSDSCYKTIRKPAISSRLARHNMPLGLDVLQIMGQCPLRLDGESWALEEEIDELKDWEAEQLSHQQLQDRQRDHEIMAATSIAVAQDLANFDGDFYLAWFFDPRGRVYPFGYHITHHGTDFKKSNLLLAIQEVTTGVPISGDYVIPDSSDDYTGWEYALIYAANCFGHDKKLFPERIQWAYENLIACDNRDQVRLTLQEQAEEPHQFASALRSLDASEQGIANGFLMELDATNSFLQIMSAMSGCKLSAKICNLLERGKRNDAYKILADIITEAMPHLVFTRQEAKDLFMKSFAYGSKKVPELLFPEPEDYAHYLRLMNQHFPGIVKVRALILSLWDSSTLAHTFTLPDGHTSHVPVTVKMTDDTARIEIAEVAPINDGRPKSVSYVHKVNVANDYNTPILANTIQAFDAWLVREVVRSCYAEGFYIVTIHDGFKCHPNNMGRLRYWYRHHLARLAEMDIMEDLTFQLTGNIIPFTKLSSDLPELIRQSEYTLS